MNSLLLVVSVPPSILALDLLDRAPHHERVTGV
jgi:hypothetical protein